MKDSLAQIAPADTAIGPPTATARRLIDASVSNNTRRTYAGAGQVSHPEGRSHPAVYRRFLIRRTFSGEGTPPSLRMQSRATSSSQGGA